MSWFKSKQPEPKKVIQIQVLHSTAMRMSDWRGSPDLVKYAFKLFNSSEFQTLLAVLRNESPASFGLPMGASHDDHISHAYKNEGYNLCLNNIEAMTVQLSTEEQPEATFAPETPQPLPPDALQLSPQAQFVESLKSTK